MSKRYTIEPEGDGEYYPVEYLVHEWGVYSRRSVLAGQQSKYVIAGFGTLEEARRAYPMAEVMEHETIVYNTVDHLPDREMSATDEEAYCRPNEYP